MKKSLLVIGLLALLVTLALSNGATPASAAGPWYVSTSGNDTNTCLSSASACKTIAAAIGKASSGDTIHVAAGTYSGNITVNKSITILGAPGDGDPGPGSNAPIIDGGLAPGDGFLIANGVSNVTIKGFEIRRFTSNATGIGNAISAWQNSTSNITIQDNYFHDLGWDGVIVGNDNKICGPANWTIKGNILEKFDAYGFELTNTSNSTIENNIIHTTGGPSGTPPINAITILAHCNASGITIRGNKIDGALAAFPSSYAAIFIAAGDSGGGTANPTNLNNVLIDNNTVSATGGRAQVYLANYTGGTVTGVQAHNNSFSIFRNSTTGAVDATLNWWGSASAPVVGAGGNIDGSGSALVTYNPYARALITSVTASTHEIGETGIMTTSVTVTGLYGAQLLVTHDPIILNWSSGVTIPVTAKSWYWDIIPESFKAVTSPTGRRLSGSNQARATGANLTSDAIAQWNYTCATPGTSALSYDTSTGNLGTKLSDKDGLEIPTALFGDMITCTAQTASVDGYIGLQGRLSGAPNPTGWITATVALNCVSGGCVGYGPYAMTTDAAGHYQLVKTGAGTGIATGTYSASVSRRGYLGANKTANVTIAAGTNTINASAVPQVPTLLGGDANDDGTINVTDLSTIGLAFGAAPGGGADTGADINGDNIVNIFDLVLGGGNFGLSTSTWP